MNIREARTKDLAAVSELLARAGGIPGIPDSAERLARVADASHAWLLVTERDGALVGCVIAAWDGWRGNIYRLAVAPEHRRKGIATELVRAAEEKLRAAGARRIGLLALRESDGAVQFWKDAGYEEDLRVLRFVRNISL